MLGGLLVAFICAVILSLVVGASVVSTRKADEKR